MSKFNRFLLNLPCGLNYWEYYIVSWHNARKGNRFAAIEPVRAAVWKTFGSIVKDVCKGMKLLLRDDILSDNKDPVVQLVLISSGSIPRRNEIAFQAMVKGAITYSNTPSINPSV